MWGVGGVGREWLGQSQRTGDGEDVLLSWWSRADFTEKCYLGVPIALSSYPNRLCGCRLSTQQSEADAHVRVRRSLPPNISTMVRQRSIVSV